MERGAPDTSWTSGQIAEGQRGRASSAQHSQTEGVSESCREMNLGGFQTNSPQCAAWPENRPPAPGPSKPSPGTPRTEDHAKGARPGGSYCPYRKHQF